MHEILEHEGINVCNSEYGKPLGDGLYEFRLRHDAEEILAKQQRSFVHKITGRQRKILLRVFFHPHGDRLILLLGGYDKAASPGKRQQQREITVARERLAKWRSRARN